MATKRDVNDIKQSINNLTTTVNDLRDDINNIKDCIIASLQEENKNLKQRIKDLEISVTNATQYERRNNLILTNIFFLGSTKAFLVIIYFLSFDYVYFVVFC